MAELSEEWLEVRPVSTTRNSYELIRALARANLSRRPAPCDAGNTGGDSRAIRWGFDDAIPFDATE
jgi:hypothetical protein